MQRVFNTLAVFSFVLALTNTSLAVFTVTRGPELLKNHIDKMRVELAQALLQQKIDSEVFNLPPIPLNSF